MFSIYFYVLFIGGLFNIVTLTIEITPERLQDFIIILASWSSYYKASLKEVQIFVGET